MTPEEKEILIQKAVNWLILNTETRHFSDGSEIRCLRMSLNEGVNNLKKELDK